jgi:hypothetical protein
MARAAEKKYAKAIESEKARHWWEWLANLGKTNLWTAHKFISAEPSDGGATRIPTLEKRHPRTKQVIATAETNEDKVEWLKTEFFPPPMVESPVPDAPQYPPPAWEWKPVSDEIMRAAVARMQPYKATYPGSEPNCVLRECADLLIPFAGPIFRAIDALGHYPSGWAELFILALRKPGKTNYADPAALRPIALSKGFVRWLNACKNLQCVSEAEIAGILPNNQYGARPGRSTTNALHLVVKTIKDAWLEGKVATVLCMDVKGAFPSVNLECAYHDM